MKAPTYDVFLSHAYEDKILADPLTASLKSKGVALWYSGEHVANATGGDLIKIIDNGLSKCSIGIIIVSHIYLDKTWTQYELDHFLEHEKTSGKEILPVLFNITPLEVAARNIVLANRIAVKEKKGESFTSEIGLESLTTKLHQRIDAIKKKRIALEKKEFTRRILVLTLLLVSFIFLGWIGYRWANIAPPDELVSEAVENRVSQINLKAAAALKEWRTNQNEREISHDQASDQYFEYQDKKSRYRNEYVLETGLSIIRSKKGTETALKLDFDILSPANSFGMDSTTIYFSPFGDNFVSVIKQLTFLNRASLRYSILSTRVDDHKYIVNVTYVNPIRFLLVTMSYPKDKTDLKRYSVEITAPTIPETYTFSKNKGNWVLESVQPGN